MLEGEKLGLSRGSRKAAVEAGITYPRLTGLLFALVLSLFGHIPVAAQSADLLSSSYITPFPQGDRYQLRVIGDWLGQGLTAGLQDAFKDDASLEIADASRSSYGLVRAEQTDLYGQVDRLLSGPPVNIAVIMLGVNDRISLKTDTGRALPGSQEWKDAYGKEAEKLIKKLRSGNVAVYWVGLPVMGNPAFNDAVAAMNDATRQAAYISGAKFIETSVGFTDQSGSYSAFGPDLSGQTKRLRESDGVGLTQAGMRKLANYVEVALRRDLAQARAQRNIPLAGDEEEQARAVPGKSKNQNAPKTAAAPATVPNASKEKNGTAASEDASAVGGAPRGPRVTATEASQRDQAVFAGGSGQQGEYVLGDLGDGLTSIAVISPVSDFSMREIQRQTPLADRLYFKVLSKGEALPAKEGRADDFRWHGSQASSTQ